MLKKDGRIMIIDCDIHFFARFVSRPLDTVIYGDTGTLQ